MRALAAEGLDVVGPRLGRHGVHAGIARALRRRRRDVSRSRPARAEGAVVRRDRQRDARPADRAHVRRSRHRARARRHGPRASRAACSRPSSSRSSSLESRVRAKKRLGQHFLHDPAVIRRLVDAIRPLPADAMVEIGGGPGALTIPLCAKLERLHVVEIDRELAAALPSRVAHPERLVVHEADALEVRLRRARGWAALAARRRQPALQHLDAAAVPSRHVRAGHQGPARDAAARGRRPHHGRAGRQGVRAPHGHALALRARRGLLRRRPRRVQRRRRRSGRPSCGSCRTRLRRSRCATTRGSRASSRSSSRCGARRSAAR